MLYSEEQLVSKHKYSNRPFKQANLSMTNEFNGRPTGQDIQWHRMPIPYSFSVRYFKISVLQGFFFQISNIRESLG